MATITCTIPSGNDYRHYLTTLAYLQDINDGMPQFFKDLLANQVELDKHIPQSLQRHPPQRNLELNAVFEFTSHKWYPNTIGMFTFVSGVQIHLPTKVCTKGISMGSRRFGDMTIVADNQYKADLKKNFRRACASCMFNSNMTRCGRRV